MRYAGEPEQNTALEVLEEAASMRRQDGVSQIIDHGFPSRCSAVGNLGLRNLDGQQGSDGLLEIAVSVCGLIWGRPATAVDNGGLRGIDAVQLNSAADVFQFARTQVAENDRKLVRHIFPHRCGHDDLAGRCKLMDARGDVHPIADQPVAIDDDVFDVDPDAQRQLDCFGFLPPLLGSPLYFERPIHRRHRARKFHQHRVTRNLEQPTAVLADRGLDDIGLERLPRAQRCHVALLDQARPASHIRERERRQTPRSFRHLGDPPQPDSAAQHV